MPIASKSKWGKLVGFTGNGYLFAGWVLVDEKRTLQMTAPIHSGEIKISGFIKIHIVIGFAVEVVYEGSHGWVSGIHLIEKNKLDFRNQFSVEIKTYLPSSTFIATLHRFCCAC